MAKMLPTNADMDAALYDQTTRHPSPGRKVRGIKHGKYGLERGVDSFVSTGFFDTYGVCEQTHDALNLHLTGLGVGLGRKRQRWERALRHLRKKHGVELDMPDLERVEQTTVIELFLSQANLDPNGWCTMEDFRNSLQEFADSLGVHLARKVHFDLWLYKYGIVRHTYSKDADILYGISLNY